MAVAVSIILPTYNRARFLSQAIESIRSQTFTDWELIVVDDGSTDNTRELVPELTAGIAQPLRYIYQENAGPYGARNTGLDHAGGKYIAFYDSDDEWLPHHLKDCVEGLEGNPDVDWVWGACQIVEHETGELLDPHTFYIAGRPRPFMDLSTCKAGRLRMIDDPRAIQCMIRDGFYNGLQNSVLRASLFGEMRFEAASRNEAEDQLAVIRALARGHRLGYIDSVHVEYRIHSENSSGSARSARLEKRLRVQTAIVEGFERLRSELALSRADDRALRQRLAREYFWLLGYSLLWQHGQRREALSAFRRGLVHWPWDLRCIKTFVLAWIRTAATSRNRTIVP